MKTRLAKSYEILNIMNFIKENSVKIPGLSANDSVHEYMATIMEHIMRNEAKLALFNDKIVGFAVLDKNSSDSFFAVDNTLASSDYDGALNLLMSAAV